MSATSSPATFSVVSAAPSVQIPQLNLKHSIQKHVTYKGIVMGIVEKIKTEIPDIDELKLDVEITKLVCSLVEDIIKKGNPFGIEKQALVLEILTKQFNLTAEEQHQVNQQITFLFDNGQIKKSKKAWLSLFFTGGQILANKIL
jgi:hypothetical protein